ncbi:hypothetical protein [Comamonas thiooxydans]
MSKNRTQWLQIAKFLQEQSPRRKVTPPPVSKRNKVYSKAVGLVSRGWKRAEVLVAGTATDGNGQAERRTFSAGAGLDFMGGASNTSQTAQK